MAPWILLAGVLLYKKLPIFQAIIVVFYPHTVFGSFLLILSVISLLEFMLLFGQFYGISTCNQSHA